MNRLKWLIASSGKFIVPYILEGLITSTSPSGEINLAPMGPITEFDDSGNLTHLLLRPFPESTTFSNLKRHPEGVFHLTDDASLLACAVTRTLELERLNFQPAETVEGHVLANACQIFEFRIIKIDETGPRMKLRAEVTRQQELRPFWGYNRANNAVLEAAILASRVHLLPSEKIEAEMAPLRTMVEKTGHETAQQAFELLEDFIQNHDSWRTFSGDGS